MWNTFSQNIFDGRGIKLLSDLKHIYDVQNNQLQSKFTSNETELISIGDVYCQLENYITDHLEKRIPVGSLLTNNGSCQNDFLRVCTNKWEQYRVLIKYLGYTCSYLYRYYIKTSNSMQNKQMFKMFIFCILLWRTIINVFLNKILVQSSFDATDVECNNQLSDCTVGSTQIESTSLFQHKSIIKYFEKMSRSANRRRVPVQSYLHWSTMNSLIITMDRIFTGTHLDPIYGELRMPSSHIESQVFWSFTDIFAIDQRTEPRPPPQITWKHLWPVKKTRKALFSSPFSSIPIEILFDIFSLLSIRDLGNVALVCRFFKMIVDRDEIWQSKCDTLHKLRLKSFKQIYIDWIYEKYRRNYKWKQNKIIRWLDPCICCRPWQYFFARPWKYPARSIRETLCSSVSQFNQHPDSSEDMIIQLSVNIDSTAKAFISLLKKVSNLQSSWCQPEILKQMIVRYYRFMQLKASLPCSILLVPTVDIEMIWQTHLSRPSMYRNDCLRLFHRVIDHSLLIDEIGQFLKEDAFLDTCHLYEAQFDEKYCCLPIIKKEADVTSRNSWGSYDLFHDRDPNYSYWDETHFEFASEPPLDYKNPFSFTETDIISNIHWLDTCKSFMFETASNIEVSFKTPDDSIVLNHTELDLLKKSYERFLYTAAKYFLRNGYDFIHTTYAIDIIRRSHMQTPLKYMFDCVRFVGYVIDLDPMTEPCGNVNEIWKHEFGTDITTDHLYKLKRVSALAMTLVESYQMEEID